MQYPGHVPPTVVYYLIRMRSASIYGVLYDTIFIYIVHRGGNNKLPGQSDGDEKNSPHSAPLPVSPTCVGNFFNGGVSKYLN